MTLVLQIIACTLVAISVLILGFPVRKSFQADWRRYKAAQHSTATPDPCAAPTATQTAMEGEQR